MTKLFFFWALLAFIAATILYLTDSNSTGHMLLGLQCVAAGLFTREFEK